VLPVFFSVSAELSDYERFAEGLLDTFTRALEISGSLDNRLRSELQKWKLSRLSVGGASFERQGTELFLSSVGSGLASLTVPSTTHEFQSVNQSVKPRLVKNSKSPPHTPSWSAKTELVTNRAASTVGPGYPDGTKRLALGEGNAPST